MNQLFTQACEDYRNGRLQEAGEGYRRLLEFFSEAPILHHNLGLVHYQLSEYEKARDSFARAAELERGDADTLFNLALSQKKCGEVEAAIATFTELLQNDPENTDTLYNLAGCYRDIGQRPEAKETYRRVLRLAPDHPSANNNLAYLHHLDGEAEPALACYLKVLEHNPHHQSAAHMVAALTGAKVACPPDAYVREVFDNYAHHFEESLVTGLSYRGPEILRSFHDETVVPGRQYAHGLDLGCGTGLAGAAFGELVAVFDGLDLSERMLAIAKDKNIYRHLYAGNIVDIAAGVEDTFDFYLAADVFIYVGDLENTFRLLRHCARPDAVFCFSTETAADVDYRLQQTGRFAHSSGYVRSTAQITGWQVVASQAAQLRKEQGVWVQSELWLLRRAQ